MIALEVPYSCSALHNCFESLVSLLGMTTLFSSPGSTYCKADDTIVFARGQELSADSRSKTSSTQHGCQVIVALVIKVEKGGGVRWGCELLPEARNDSSSND